MRPFIALSYFLSMAYGAPAHTLAGFAGAPLGVAAYAGAHLGVAGYAASPVATQSFGPAPAGHGLVAGAITPLAQAPYIAPAAPAPYTTVHQGPGATTVHQPPSVITKQVHLGQTNYVSGYATRILKPATPYLPIAVPTVLKGSVAYNAPIIKEQIQVHNVQTPVLVERRVEIPYDVAVYKDNIIQVPTPVHVDAPYNVPVPVAVRGATIIKKTVAPAVVTHSLHAINAGVTGHIQNAPIVAPAVGAGYAHAGFAHGAYAGAPAVSHY